MSNPVRGPGIPDGAARLSKVTPSGTGLRALVARGYSGVPVVVYEAGLYEDTCVPTSVPL